MLSTQNGCCLCQPQGAHTDIKVFTHTRETCTGPRMLTPAQDTCTHSTGLCPHFSPGSSLVPSVPLAFLLSAFQLAFQDSEVAVWWERQSLRLLTRPESASVQQSLLFWYVPSPSTQSQDTTKQQ